MVGTLHTKVYTPYEVAMHNSPADCWVSLLGKVLDITRLVKVLGTMLCPEWREFAYLNFDTFVEA
jgi:hypothetical protein